MNELSWIILLAVYIQNIGVLFGIIALLSGVAALIMLLVWGLNEEFQPDSGNHLFSKAKKFGVVFLVSLGVCGLFPSKEAIYLIAASEYGGEAMETERGQKAMDVLDAFLENKLKEYRQSE